MGRRHTLLSWVIFCAATAACEAVAAAENDPPPAEIQGLERKRGDLASFVYSLRDPDLAKVRKAVAGLLELGQPQVSPVLWQLYDTGEGQRRVLALDAIGRLKAPGQEERMFEASLAEALCSLRRLAAESLARLAGREEAARRYLQALDTPGKLTPLGRVRTAQLLGHLGGQEAAERLKALLKDKDTDVAVAACDGLAEIGALANAPTLIAALGRKDVDAEVRPALAEGLEALTGQKNGANLVQWEQWAEDWKAGRFKAAPPDPNETGTGVEEASTYSPPPDPYKRAVQESPVDLAVVFDTTRSMNHIWPEFSSALDAVLREIVKHTPSVRLGGVRYRAGDPSQTLTYLIQPKALTRKLQEARDFLLDASFGGGSGGLHLGIQHAISALAWRAQARKVVLVVGDFTPLDAGLQKCLGMLREGREHDRIVFHVLYCATLHGDEHRETYHLLAQAGGGRFYEYNKTWSHLVDMSAEKVEPKKTELASETYLKWLTPRSEAGKK